MHYTLKYGDKKNKLHTKNIYESVQSVLDIFDNQVSKGLSLIKEILTSSKWSKWVDNKWDPEIQKIYLCKSKYDIE